MGELEDLPTDFELAYSDASQHELTPLNYDELEFSQQQSSAQWGAVGRGYRRAKKSAKYHYKKTRKRAYYHYKRGRKHLKTAGKHLNKGLKYAGNAMKKAAGKLCRVAFKHVAG